MHPKTPSELSFPAYLLNFPFTVDNGVINNVLMKDYAGEPYDYNKAFNQFMNLYKYLAARSLVYLLPSEGDFQDQTYVANLGCYLPHLTYKPTVVISRFQSQPRIGEELVGIKFFDSMGYRVYQPPWNYTFEGEADLKWLRDNIYVGGHGMRTNRHSYYWMMDTLGAEITMVEMSNPKNYHFDCMFLPLTGNKALVDVTDINPADVRKLEKIVEIVPLPKEASTLAWTNCIMYGKKVFHTPVIDPSGEDLKNFIDFIEKIGFEPVIIDLSEFEKSGASLSCMIFHLNYKARS